MAGSRTLKQPLLSLEQLLQQWGKALPHPKFDPEHAVSYRTWLAIANYVAYHDPLLLNGLFQGVEFPASHLDEGTVRFPERIEEVMLDETRAKYVHLKLNHRHYGSIQTRLRLFENVIQVVGDPGANFRVGRNIQIMPEIGALKLTFQSTLKGLSKIVGVNPATILQARVPEANRALNKFLDTRVVQYGPDFMDVRVEYLRAEDVSAEGDHYTLGIITAGLEAVSAYKKIRIRALQTPLNEEQEMNKANLHEPGLEYIFRGYFYKPDVPVFLYRYYFQEQLGLLERIARAFRGIVREKLPSRLTRGELREEEKNRALLAQGEELDLRFWREHRARTEAAEARTETAEARAAAAEARQALEYEVSGTNRFIAETRRMAHDSKNHALDILAAAQLLWKQTVLQYGDYLQRKNVVAPLERTLSEILEQDGRRQELLNTILTDTETPSEVRSATEHLQRLEGTVSALVESLDHVTSARKSWKATALQHPDYFLRQGLVPPLESSLEAVLEDEARYRELLEFINSDRQAPFDLRRITGYLLFLEPKVALIIENERTIMGGGERTPLEAVLYTDFMSPAVESVRRVYPAVKISYAPEELVIPHGNQRLLRVAFLNLLNNAAEASLPSGKVTIQQQQIQKMVGLYTIINLHQSGLLSEEIAQRLNRGEEFSTKPQGNGVGASSSYHIITTIHNGSIRYQSQGAEGALITITI